MLSAPAARAGRPARPSRRREVILRCARALFASKGFGGASIRAVAARARVDPALVMHYFGSKQGLFEAAIRPPVESSEVAAVAGGPRRTLGRRVATFYVETIFRTHGQAAASLLRSALSDRRAAALLRAALHAGPLAAIRRALKDPRSALRGELVGSHMMGIFLARHLLEIEPLASLPDAELIELVSPTLQRYLTGPLRGGR